MDLREFWTEGICCWLENNKCLYEMIRDWSTFNDPNTIWMTILELNGNLPKPKRKETVVDTYLRQAEGCHVPELQPAAGLPPA